MARGRVRAAVLAGVSVLVSGLLAPAGPATGAEAAATPDPGVYRISGVDRYEASAAISASTFAPGIHVAYVATGATFADALSGGPLGGYREGPVLLVRRDAIPPSVSTELDRLRPDHVVILGGPASVSTDVARRLKSHAETLTRLSGADRYEVSAAASASVFEPGVPVAYVATGEKYPDALSGGPAAGLNGGPVLLVRQNEIPASIAAELARLQPAEIVVLGGPVSVSTAVKRALEAYTDGQVTRLSGADRYEASAAISEATFASRPAVAYIATGEKFPDALSGGPVGAVNGGPVLLVRAGSIPAAVASELTRLQPRRIVILGGPASVSIGVQEALDSLLVLDSPPSIRGRVSQDGGAGAPLAGVAVTLSGPSLAGGPAFATATDANGIYRFFGVPAADDILVCFDGRDATGGTLDVTGYGDECWEDARDPALPTPVTVTASATRTGVDADLRALGQKTLRFADSAGGGLAGVAVYLYGAGSSRYDGVTTETGNVRVRDVYPGTYRVCYDTYNATGGLAGPYGYDDFTDCQGAGAALAPTVEIHEGTVQNARTTFTVTASGVVEGHVTDPAGDAVVGAEVTVLNEVVPGDGLVADGVTAADGSYQIGDVRGEQEHRVCVSAASFVPTCVEGVFVREAATSRLDVRLAPAP